MKCLNTRAKLIIQQLYESMFHEPYMLTEGSHAKINNNPAFMPVVIEKVGRLPGYGEVISIAHYGEQSGDLMADPEMEFTIIGGDYYPISFRNDYLGKHNSIFEDDGINLPQQHDLTTFAINGCETSQNNRILRHSDNLQLKCTQCRDILRC